MEPQSNMHKLRTTRPDGRYLVYYSFGDGRYLPAADDMRGRGLERPAGSSESHMRWNPVLEQWNVVATHRQDRTFLPAVDQCPFCPTRDPDRPTEIPSPEFEIVAFENRFPSFLPGASVSGLHWDDLYRMQPALGACEVIVYTPDHQASVAQLGAQHIRNLVEVWADRFEELGALEHVRYVFIFENKGERIGVTLHHPHGQIYGFPTVPPVPESELTSSYVFKERTGQCLFCHILERELAEGSRVVYENQDVLAIVPFYARWPYEVHILPKQHASALPDLDDVERMALARALKAVTSKYDNLFGFPMPYVMSLHQRPTDGADHSYYHMHFEFYPPHRTHDKLKYMAGVELGMGMFLLDAAPEDKAQELRDTPPREV